MRSASGLTPFDSAVSHDRSIVLSGARFITRASALCTRSSYFVSKDSLNIRKAAESPTLEWIIQFRQPVACESAAAVSLELLLTVDGCASRTFGETCRSSIYPAASFLPFLSASSDMRSRLSLSYSQAHHFLVLVVVSFGISFHFINN